MQTGLNEKVAGLREQRAVLPVKLTSIARKGGVEFAGYRGLIDGGELAGTPAFLPASNLGWRSQRCTNHGVEGLTTSGTILELNTRGPRPTLVLSERGAAAELAQSESELLHVFIRQVQRPSGSERIAGFAGEIRHSQLGGMRAFFPLSQMEPLTGDPEILIGTAIHGVIVGENERNFVLSQTQATALAFERIPCGHRLRMMVEREQDGHLLLRQPAGRGAPLTARMNIGELAARGVSVPPTRTEVLVLITGKQPATADGAPAVLTVTIDNSALQGDPRWFCVTCQKEHTAHGLGFCQDCEACLYKHSHQVIDNDGSSVDGCFFRCELCGSENFWD